MESRGHNQSQPEVCFCRIGKQTVVGGGGGVANVEERTEGLAVAVAQADGSACSDSDPWDGPGLPPRLTHNSHGRLYDNYRPLETIATDPKTGGQKGRKLETFSLIPAEGLAEIAKVYEYGSRKYSAHNWRKGYPYSWSLDAMLRHIFAFIRGEDRDPESGLLHLAHAGFHVLALLTYMSTGRGTDDRYGKGDPQ